MNDLQFQIIFLLGYLPQRFDFAFTVSVLLPLCLLFDKVLANVLVDQQHNKDYFLAVLVGFLSCLWFILMLKFCPTACLGHVTATTQVPEVVCKDEAKA